MREFRKTYANKLVTEKGRELLRFPIVGAAVVECRGDGWTVLEAVPIEIFSVAKGDGKAFDHSPMLDDPDGRVVGVIPTPGTYMVLAMEEDSYVLGYEFPGATHPDWDAAYDSMVPEDERVESSDGD